MGSKRRLERAGVVKARPPIRKAPTPILPASPPTSPGRPAAAPGVHQVGGFGPGLYRLENGKVTSFTGVADMALPAPDTSAMSEHDLYAEAVHRAVCDSMGTVDIAGHCMASTYAGWMLTIAHPPGPGKWHPQAGSLYLNPNPDHPTAAFGFCAKDGGIGRGEFHAWLAHMDGGRIDFAARYYRRYVEKMAVTGIEGFSPDEMRWNRPDPPAYLWAHYRDLPDWVTLVTDDAASQAMMETFVARHEGFATLRRSVLAHYDRLKAAS